MVELSDDLIVRYFPSYSNSGVLHTNVVGVKELLADSLKLGALALKYTIELSSSVTGSVYFL